MSMHVTIGRTGMGKTHVSVYQANKWEQEGKNVLYLTNEHAPNELYETFQLSKNVSTFFYDNLTIENIQDILKKEAYDVVLLDSVFPLLLDSDSHTYYPQHYPSIYQLLEMIAVKKKIDIHLTRQLPYLTGKEAYSLSDVEECEKRAETLHVLTECKWVEKDALYIQAKELRNDDAIEITYRIA